MELLSPWYLAAAAAVAVPLWLHLRRQRTQRRIPFPAVRYLRAARRALAQRLQMRHWLLLAARLLLVLAAALLAAGLLFGRGDAPDHPPTRIAIVLDPSASAGLVEDERTVLDLLRERALRTVALAGPEDRLWIVRATRPEAALGPLAPSEAATRLREIEPSAGAADLGRAVSAAAAIVSGAGPAEVHLLSDLQVSNLGTAPDALATPLIIYGPRDEPPPNVALTDVRTAQSPVTAAEQPLVLARVERFGPTSGDEEAEWAVRAATAGRVVSLSSTKLGSDVALVLPAASSGWISGSVEIDPSGLRADDRRFFTVPVREPPRVAVRGEPGPFVAAALDALAAGGRLRLASGPVDVVWSVGGEGLEEAVGMGRRAVVVPPEDPLALPRLNSRLERIGIGWRFTLEGERGLARLADGAGGGGGAARVPGLAGQTVRLVHRLERSVPGPATVSIRLESGEPWLVASEPPGRGRVLLLASPLTTAGTDLVAAPAMIPFVDALVNGWPDGADLSEVEGSHGFTLPPRATAVELPSGARRAVEGGGVFRDVDEAGIYRVWLGDSLVRQVAINPPAAESDLSRADDASLERLWPDARIVRGGDLDDWERAVFRVRRGGEAAPFLLGLLLLLALVETAAAAAGGDRTKATDPSHRG